MGERTNVRDELAGLLHVEASATFSPDRVYRYNLERIWRPAGDRMLFIMLNPSTADAFILDPTVRRCKAFAEREHCGSLEVVNLFALRSTDPKALYSHPDPVGPDNRDAIEAAVDRSDFIVAGWGVHAAALAETVANQPVVAEEAVDGTGKPLLCLGRTKDGHPRHPLYVKANQPLEAL